MASLISHNISHARLSGFTVFYLVLSITEPPNLVLQVNIPNSILIISIILFNALSFTFLSVKTLLVADC